MLCTKLPYMSVFINHQHIRILRARVMHFQVLFIVSSTAIIIMYMATLHSQTWNTMPPTPSTTLYLK